jgi:HSP20 family protein
VAASRVLRASTPNTPNTMSTNTRSPSRAISKFLDDDLIGLPESFLAETRRFFPDRMFPRDILMPAVNITDNGTDFTVELAAPGYKKEDLKVSVKDGLLTISSQKKEEQEEKGKGYTRKEFHSSSFSRSFTLPTSVDTKSVDASFTDGVLRIKLAKHKAAAEQEGQSIVIR